MNIKEKAQWLGNFYQELADNDNGFSLNNITVSPQDDPSNGPKLNSDTHLWSVNPPKPKKEIIDLSIMVNSNIDMEFDFLDNKWKTSYLIEIAKEGYINKYGSVFDRCRIRQNHWHSWNGAKCPLPKGLFIATKRKSLHSNIVFYGETSSEYLNWKDIIAFKITGIEKKYKYEWQNE